ncbi:MAG: ABC transporter permease [Clostridiaceae bacterium]|nr:ABC transporter permease [Clostridiaceae bacterium]
MSSVLALCRQDFRRLLTNALFWVLTATLVVIVLVVDLALPKESAAETYHFYTYQFDIPSGEALSSADAVRAAVEKGDALGLIADQNGITLVHPGLSDKTVTAIMQSLSGVLPVDIPVTRLRESAEAVPFHLRHAPVFICFEALITGFILGGALMLAEKEEGTVNALRIAPMGVFRYLISKTLLFGLIGTLYSVLICCLTVGFKISWLPFLLLAFFGTTVFTLVGLAYTTFFRDMSGWFFSTALLLSINMLPLISFELPSFSPGWIRVIPSYPLLFAFNAVMFGGEVDFLRTAGSIALWCAAAYLAAHVLTRRLFLKGARGV